MYVYVAGVAAVGDDDGMRGSAGFGDDEEVEVVLVDSDDRTIGSGSSTRDDVDEDYTLYSQNIGEILDVAGWKIRNDRK